MWMKFLVKYPHSYILGAGSAFYFQPDYLISLFEDKIHFVISLSPIMEVIPLGNGMIEQMGSNRRLNQPTPQFRINYGIRICFVTLRSQKRIVIHLELWTG